MNEPKTDSGAEVPCTCLLGTTWRHKKKGGVYTVTQTAPKRGDVYLAAQTKGCRSTWKAECLLAWDYELVPNGRGQGCEAYPVPHGSTVISSR